MADPVIVTCTRDTFIKIASNILTGMVHRLTDAKVLYEYTYREAGQPAPVAPADLPEVVRLFDKPGPDDISVPIESSFPIDVYIYAQGEIDGSVRVDI